MSMPFFHSLKRLAYWLPMAIWLLSGCKSQHFSYQAQQERRAQKSVDQLMHREAVGSGGVSAPNADGTVSGTPGLGNERLMAQDQIIRTAREYMGTPHVLGGMSQRGIDCSGLVIRAFESIGQTMPRIATDQAKTGRRVEAEDVARGDLIFFLFPGQGKISHVGIVTETHDPRQVMFIHASSSQGVREDNLFSDYWWKHFQFIRRMF